MKACDVFIGAGGYNTLAEVLANKVNAIIIPRHLSDTEQQIHTSFLTPKKLIRVIDRDILKVDIFKKTIVDAFYMPYPFNEEYIRTNGATVNAAYIDEIMS